MFNSTTVFLRFIAAKYTWLFLLRNLYHSPVCKGALPPRLENESLPRFLGSSGEPSSPAERLPTRLEEAALPSADTDLKLSRASLGVGLSGCRQAVSLSFSIPHPARSRMRAQRVPSHTNAHLIQLFYCFLLWDPHMRGCRRLQLHASCAPRLLVS